MPTSENSDRSQSRRSSYVVSSGQSNGSNFHVLKELGKGAFAKVYKVRRQEDEKEYALKQVDVGAMKKKEVQDAFNEIRILCTFGKEFAHPRLVRLYETFLNSNQTQLSIVMEYCACGDLSEKVERYKIRKTYIDERVIWVYLIQIAEGLKGLHQMGILHRDLKAANCFLAEDGSIKIGDMNVSKVVRAEGGADTQIGTPYYMAPEIWKCKPYGEGVDIWALGCLIFELCSLRPPFLAQSLQELKSKVLAGRFPRIPRTYSQNSDDLQNVITKLLDLNPANRPSAVEILALPEVERRKTLVKNAMTEEWIPPQAVRTTLHVRRIEQSSNTSLPQLPPAQYDDDSDDEDNNEEESKTGGGNNNPPSIIPTSSRSTTRSSLDHKRRGSVGRERGEGKEEEKDSDDEEEEEKTDIQVSRQRKSSLPSIDSRRASGSRRGSLNPVKAGDINSDVRRASLESSPPTSEGTEKERRNSLIQLIDNAKQRLTSLRPRASSLENNSNNNVPVSTERRASKGTNDYPTMVNGAGVGKRRGSTSSVNGERRGSFILNGK